MPKRLFLFASYDRDAVIDDYVINYVRALFWNGDVIFYMDSDAAPEELDKVRPYTIHAHAERHHSYDFGSYKRAYQWASEQGILANYDFLYLCNDSCFGPFRPLWTALENMESRDADWFGMVADTSAVSGIRYIQSWFIGMRPRVFLSDWYRAFIDGMTQENGKDGYIQKYELFMSRLAQILGASFFVFFEPGAGDVYNKCDALLAAGMPFIKRLGYFAFTKKSPVRGFVARTRALRMLEPEQREMVLKYLRRINPVVAWLVMHPRTYAFIYLLKQALKKLLGIKITSSRRKEMVVRIFGVPVFYKNRQQIAGKF